MIRPQSFQVFVKITMSIFDFPTFLCNFAYSYDNHLQTFYNEKKMLTFALADMTCSMSFAQSGKYILVES